MKRLTESVQVVSLFEDQLFLASSKGSKPAAADIDLSEYQYEKFLTLQDGFATTSEFSEAFQFAGFKPNVGHEGGRYLLANEYGIRRSGALLPGRVVRR